MGFFFNFTMNKTNQSIAHKQQYQPPAFIRLFCNFVIENGKNGYRVTVQLESIRVMYYLTLFLFINIGKILTVLFVEHDFTAIIMDVYGAKNVCTYLDFPPATYVLPFAYTFPMICLIAFNIASIFRISVAYRERKISSFIRKSLNAAHVYILISAIWFGTCFAVQPDRNHPITMIVHSIPYLNLKIAWCALSISEVCFGSKVSWNNLFAPKGRQLFVSVSWLFCVLQLIFTLVAITMILNALGDMGQGGLVGKGLFWSVQDPMVKKVMDISVNNGEGILDFHLPLLHAFYLSWIGFNDATRSHTISFTMSDSLKRVD